MNFDTVISKLIFFVIELSQGLKTQKCLTVATGLPPNLQHQLNRNRLYLLLRHRNLHIRKIAHYDQN